MSKPNHPVYLNGEIVPADRAKVSVFDRGIMRGDGLFETMRTYHGRIFKIEEHLARLDRGLEALRYPVRLAGLGLKAAIEETVHVSGLESARVRAEVTRGTGSGKLTAHTNTPPTVIVTVEPIIDTPFKPLDVIISSIRRDEKSPLSGIKTINYVPGILALMEAEDSGADDAILLNYAGNVAECGTSNVFIMREGVLITPDLASGILSGIVRQTVIDIAGKLGIPAEERQVAPSELDSADEIFLTSSGREIAPVRNLNGRPVGSGLHEMAERMQAEYRLLAER